MALFRSATYPFGVRASRNLLDCDPPDVGVAILPTMSRVNKFQEGHGQPKESWPIPGKKRKPLKGITCPTCDGSGELAGHHGQQCYRCWGRGIIPKPADC